VKTERYSNATRAKILLRSEEEMLDVNSVIYLVDEFLLRSCLSSIRSH